MTQLDRMTIYENINRRKMQELKDENKKLRQTIEELKKIIRQNEEERLWMSTLTTQGSRISRRENSPKKS